MTVMTQKSFGQSTLDNIQLEQERLAAVERYDVLDTPREEAFDRITRLTQKVMRPERLRIGCRGIGPLYVG